MHRESSNPTKRLDKGRGTLQENVYEALKKMIITGTISSGEKVSESWVAKKLNVSRTPVREALFRLMQEGWLSKKDNSGVFVKRLSKGEIEEIANIRTLLTEMVIDKVIDNSDSDAIEVLEKNIELCRHYMGIAHEENLNFALHEFHAILHDIASCPYVTRALKGLADQNLITRSMSLKVPGVQRTLISDHEHILEAIRRRDKARARSLIRRHIQKNKKRILKVLETGQ